MKRKKRDGSHINMCNTHPKTRSQVYRSDQDNRFLVKNHFGWKDSKRTFVFAVHKRLGPSTLSGFLHLPTSQKYLHVILE